jgi:DNA-binding XRE family transcriptional regulator
LNWLNRLHHRKIDFGSAFPAQPAIASCKRSIAVSYRLRLHKAMATVKEGDSKENGHQPLTTSTADNNSHNKATKSADSNGSMDAQGQSASSSGVSRLPWPIPGGVAAASVSGGSRDKSDGEEEDENRYGLDGLDSSKVLKHILNKTTNQKGGHKVWNGSRMHTGDNLRGTAIALTEECWANPDKAPDWNDRLQLHPYIWLDMAYRGKFTVTDRHRFVYKRTCTVEYCISHWERHTANLKCVKDMTDFDLKLARSQFLEKCDERDANGCVNWKGELDKQGHGMWHLFGRPESARRVAWKLNSRQDVPEGMWVYARCPAGNPLCVAPQHLNIGTPAQVSAQHASRRKRGQESAVAKMTNEQVRRIIETYKNGQTAQQRADEIGVNVESVHQIDSGRSWQSMMTKKELAVRLANRRGSDMNRERAREIKIRLARGEKQSALADKFGVTTTQICNIAKGRSWASVKIDAEEDRQIEAAEKERSREKAFTKAIARIMKRVTIQVDKSDDGTPPTEHWLWDGNNATNSTAQYPSIGYRGRTVHVHVASWLAHNKQDSVPAGKMIMRENCRYNHCVNPKCLRAGTAADIQRQRFINGTAGIGEQNGNSKLSAEKVLQIRENKDNKTRNELSKEFGTTASNIHKVQRGQAWTHVGSGATGQTATATLTNSNACQMVLNGDAKKIEPPSKLSTTPSYEGSGNKSIDNPTSRRNIFDKPPSKPAMLTTINITSEQRRLQDQLDAIKRKRQTHSSSGSEANRSNPKLKGARLVKPASPDNPSNNNRAKDQDDNNVGANNQDDNHVGANDEEDERNLTPRLNALTYAPTLHRTAFSADNSDDDCPTDDDDPMISLLKQEFSRPRDRTKQ